MTWRSKQEKKEDKKIEKWSKGRPRDIEVEELSVNEAWILPKNIASEYTCCQKADEIPTR